MFDPSEFDSCDEHIPSDIDSLDGIDLIEFDETTALDAEIIIDPDEDVPFQFPVGHNPMPIGLPGASYDTCYSGKQDIKLASLFFLKKYTTRCCG